MAAVAGLTARLLQGITPAVMTAQATTSLGGNVYQITDATRRILDPATVVVVDDGGVPIAASGIDDIDFMTGTVTLAAAPSGVVTIDAAYVPTVDIADCFGVSINDSTELYDATVFATSDVATLGRRRIAGLTSIDVEISSLQLLATEPGGDDDFVIRELVDQGKPILVEIRLAALAPLLRVWAILSAANIDSPIDGRIESSITASSTLIPTANAGYEASFAYTF